MEKTTHIKLDNPSVETAEHYIRMVGMDAINGCILLGPPGMGKTHLVRHTLDEMDVEYEAYGGHITLAEVYEYLFENKDGLIFFDDVSQVINKTEIMEMLKQALNTSGSRRLHYRSKNVLSENVPKYFDFTGQMIFAFNLMDLQNPNVRAIMDRAPVVELKYSRKEIMDAMYAIAKGETGGLMEYEKMIVTKEIEDYTDSTMDVSLRKQQLAFKIYRSFKHLYGETNNVWKTQVQKLFGKKKRSWLEQLIIDLVGERGKIKRTELVKEIALTKDMSTRTAHRKINEFIEMEIIYQNKIKGGFVSMKPFGGKK